MGGYGHGPPPGGGGGAFTSAFTAPSNAAAVCSRLHVRTASHILGTLVAASVSVHYQATSDQETGNVHSVVPTYSQARGNASGATLRDQRVDMVVVGMVVVDTGVTVAEATVAHPEAVSQEQPRVLSHTYWTLRSCGSSSSPALCPEFC